MRIGSVGWRKTVRVGAKEAWAGEMLEEEVGLGILRIVVGVDLGV